LREGVFTCPTGLVLGDLNLVVLNLEVETLELASAESLQSPSQLNRGRRRVAHGVCGEILMVLPTILRAGPYRVYFYSHEPREPAHVHVDRDDQSAKFWLTPIRLAINLGFSAQELRRIQQMLIDNEKSLVEKWNERFGD
jgi:hypothetical protein